MQAVLGLIEHHAVCRFEHLIGDFHAAVQPVLFGHLLTERGLVVVKRRQAVQEFDVRVTGQFHHRHIDLIRLQQRDTLLPGFFRLAHRYPHVGIQKVRVLHPFGNVFGQGDLGAGLFCQCLALCHQLRLWPAGLRRHQSQVHARQGGSFQQGVAHVVAGVAKVGELHLAQRLAR
ncbi:hypothetical protein D3C78_1330010 [compost metagenome]